MFKSPQTFRLQLKNDRLHCTRQRKLDDLYEADVVWKLDMMGKLGVSQHNMANCSMLHIDGRLFVCVKQARQISSTCRLPMRPSFLALDAKTERRSAVDDSSPVATSCTLSGRRRLMESSRGSLR